MSGQLRNIGNFHLTRLLHEGEKSEVYEARYSMMGGVVQMAAIKVLRQHLACIGEELRGFLHEVSWARDLRHSIFPRVVEAGEHGGYYFLAMEFIDGWTLSELLRSIAVLQVPLPCDVGLAIAHELADGMQTLHDFEEEGQLLGVVHLGLEPDNIMLRKSGGIALLDFGMTLSAATGEVAEPAAGAEDYQAPETTRMLPLDQRADVYSLGRVLASLAQCMPAEAVGEDLPALISRACQMHAEERFPNMRAFQSAIEIVAQNRGLTLDSKAPSTFAREIFGGTAGRTDPRARRPQSVAPMRMHSEGLKTAFAPPVEEDRHEKFPPPNQEGIRTAFGAMPSNPTRDLQHTVSPQAPILSAATVVGGPGGQEPVTPKHNADPHVDTMGEEPIPSSAEGFVREEPTARSEAQSPPERRFVGEHEAVTVAGVPLERTSADAEEVTEFKNERPVSPDDPKKKAWPEEMIPTVSYAVDPKDDD